MDKLLKGLHSKNKSKTIIRKVVIPTDNVKSTTDEGYAVVWKHTIDTLKMKLLEAEEENKFIFNHLESQLDHSNELEKKHDKLKALVQKRDSLATIPEDRIVKSVRINPKLDFVITPDPPKRTMSSTSVTRIPAPRIPIPRVRRMSSSPDIGKEVVLKSYLKRKK